MSNFGEIRKKNLEKKGQAQKGRAIALVHTTHVLVFNMYFEHTCVYVQQVCEVSFTSPRTKLGSFNNTSIGEKARL